MSISALLSKIQSERHRQMDDEEPTPARAFTTNLSIHEQVSEFLVTNGDQFLLPYLNKFEKATLAQGKPPP